MGRQQQIEELTKTFLTAMNLSLSATVTEAEDHVRVDLDGPDAYLMLERKASVLDAFQLLLGKVAEARAGLDTRLVVDCGGYRREQEEQLVQLALQTAEKAKRTGQPYELDPLNPYERRLVHLALKDEDGVSSHSIGDGFLKRIVISPD